MKGVYAGVCFIGIGAVALTMAFFAFQEYEDRRQHASAFVDFTNYTPLIERLKYVPPQSLGVSWSLGDQATYVLKVAAMQEEFALCYQVAADGPKDSGLKWLVSWGQESIVEQAIRSWRLLDESDLRGGAEVTGILEVPGLMTFPYNKRAGEWKLVAEPMGEERLELELGAFDTKRVFIMVESDQGLRMPFVELWYSKQVSPLGIVKARWREWVFTLDSLTSNEEDVESTIEETEVIRQAPIRTISCTRCHEPGVGGIDVAWSSPYKFSGHQIRFPEVLYHWRQFGSELKNEMTLRLLGESKLSDDVRFFTIESALGQLRVYPDRSGEVVWTPTEILSSEAFTVSAPERVGLILNPEIRLNTPSPEKRRSMPSH